MKKLHYWLKNLILQTVDFFYPPFRRFMPQQLFRYAVCGGANMALGMFLYPIFYNFIFKKELVYTDIIVISPHIASLLANLVITLPIGFYLSMYVVFPGSDLRRRIQFTRYFLVAMINLFLNYILLKIFVEVFHWFPTPSYWITVVLVVLFTYIAQRNFTFRKKKEELTPYEQSVNENQQTNNEQQN